MCVDMHNIVCILCVCIFFLILRNIHIKLWYGCLVREATSNNFVMPYTVHVNLLYDMYIYYCYK
jgi:hypothetical protein